VPVIFDIHRTPPRRRPPLKALKIQSLTLSITAKWHRPHARPSEPLLQMYVQPPTSKPSQIHKRLTCPPRRPRKNPLRYQSLPNRNQTPLPSPQRPPRRRTQNPLHSRRRSRLPCRQQVHPCRHLRLLVGQLGRMGGRRTLCIPGDQDLAGDD
jgi:hypothetical protein